MKKMILASLLLSASLALASKDLKKNLDSSSARRGSEGVGGGDLCEARIKAIRDDIQNWILNNESKGLNLPSSMTVEKYNSQMLTQIKKANVSCVASGDSGYPVTVSGTPKVCRFDRTTSASRITCDSNKFQAMSESDQYVLVHHEFAGLAQIENPVGDSSDYSISNQLTAHLVDEVVKKLAIGPKESRPPQVEIRYKSPETELSVRVKMGVTEEFYNTLVAKKLTSLAYGGECGTSLSQAFNLQKISVRTVEDSAQEEVLYLDIYLEFDKLILSYRLIEVQGAGYKYEPVIDAAYECVN